MLLYDLLAYLGGSLLALCLLPQLRVMWANRSAKDVSWLWTILYMIGLSLTFLYLLLIDALAGYIAMLPQLLLAVVLMITKRILDHESGPVCDDGSATGSAADITGNSKSINIPAKPRKDFRPRGGGTTALPHTAYEASVGRLLRALSTVQFISGWRNGGESPSSSPVRTRIVGKHMYLDYYQVCYENVALRDISKWLLRSIESCFDYYQKTKLTTTVTMLQTGSKTTPVGFNIHVKLQKFYIMIYSCSNNEGTNTDIVGLENNFMVVSNESVANSSRYVLRFDIYHPEASSADDLIPSGGMSDLSTVDNDVYVSDNQLRQIVDLIHISITERFHATVFNIHNVVIQERTTVDAASNKAKDGLLPHQRKVPIEGNDMPPHDEEEGSIWLSRSSSSDFSMSV